MTGAFSTPQNRRVAFAFLAISGLLAIAAAMAGINDNPPGILLALLAATALVLAFVHPWRSARKFLFLLLASVLGFVLYVILNIGLDAVSATSGVLQDRLLSPLVDALNIIFIMICLAAFLVGAVGSAVMAIRNRR
jgi:uncharacterized membrane protein (UPF0136 family)